MIFCKKLVIPVIMCICSMVSFCVEGKEHNVRIKDLLGIESANDVRKVAIVDFNQKLTSPFLGNREHDNYYNLFRGEDLKITDFLHRYVESRDSINELISYFSSLKSAGKSQYRYPEIPGQIAPIVFKDLIIIHKNTAHCLLSLIIIYRTDGAPVLLWQDLDDTVNIKGYKFKTDLYNDQVEPSLYERIYYELRASRPPIDIFY